MTLGIWVPGLAALDPEATLTLHLLENNEVIVESSFRAMRTQSFALSRVLRLRSFRVLLLLSEARSSEQQEPPSHRGTETWCVLNPRTKAVRP
jgi:hypothetical protein